MSDEKCTLCLGEGFRAYDKDGNLNGLPCLRCGKVWKKRGGGLTRTEQG
jgi:hypothetical protein